MNVDIVEAVAQIAKERNIKREALREIIEAIDALFCEEEDQ